MKAKKEYEILLEVGELTELYPELTGEWKKDREAFISIWEKNQEVIKDFDTDYEEI